MTQSCLQAGFKPSQFITGCTTAQAHPQLDSLAVAIDDVNTFTRCTPYERRHEVVSPLKRLGQIWDECQIKEILCKVSRRYAHWKFARCRTGQRVGVVAQVQEDGNYCAYRVGFVVGREGLARKHGAIPWCLAVDVPVEPARAFNVEAIL